MLKEITFFYQSRTLIFLLPRSKVLMQLQSAILSAYHDMQPILVIQKRFQSSLFNVIISWARKASYFGPLGQGRERHLQKHKKKFFPLVILDSANTIQTQKMTTMMSNIPKILDSVQCILEDRHVPDGYKFTKHMVQEALIISFIYGFKVPPKKLLPSILSLYFPSLIFPCFLIAY